MFEHHFGLRENPFVSGHQSRFVYPSREHQEALAHLRFGIENREPFVLITGEVGTGKTTALYDVLSEYESRAVVALITNTSLTRDELLEEVCLRFGLPSAGQLSKPQMLVALERFLKQVRARGHHAILILDEAQNLDRDLLEEIRLLSNLEEQGNKLIQLFLLGQPELEDKLARAELRQLRQRITVFYRLRPLTPEDTEHYIHHRISVAGGHALTVFPVATCNEVHAITHGIPREINTVAAQALLNAFVEDSPSVRPDHVRGVERDNEFRSVLRGPGGGRISTLDAAPGDAGAAGGSSAAAAPAPVAAAPKIEPAPAVAPAPVVAAPKAPAPVVPGPPPATPVEAHASAPPAPSVPPPSAPGPPPLHLETTAPAVGAAAAPAPEIVASEDDGPRKSGVAPAGSAEVWGTWLTSLSKLPAEIDDTLEEELAAEAAAHARAEAQSPVAPASVSAPAASTPSPSAPARPEPARRAEAPAPVRLAPSPASKPVPDDEEGGERKPRRLEFLDEEPPEEGARTLRWMILAGSVAVIVVGAVLGFRAWKSSAKNEAPAEAAAVSPQSTETSASPAPTTTTGQQTTAPTPVQSAPTPAPTSPPQSRPAPPTASNVPPPSPTPSTSSAPSPHPAASGSAPAASSTPSAPSSSHDVAAGVAGGTAAGAAAAGSGGAAAGGAAAGGAAASGGAAAGGASVGGQSASAPTSGASAGGGEAAGTQSKAPPAAQALFGVVVGTFLEEERANEEAAKLTSTNLPTHVVSVTENEATVYRLVLGSFGTRKEAEKTASSLIERGLVDEARVVSLGAATASKQ
jgi:type II secretory pathway predicted ATPase ExeA